MTVQLFERELRKKILSNILEYFSEILNNSYTIVEKQVLIQNSFQKRNILCLNNFRLLSWCCLPPFGTAREPYLIFRQQFTFPEGMGDVVNRQAQVVGAAFKMESLRFF